MSIAAVAAQSFIYFVDGPLRRWTSAVGEPTLGWVPTPSAQHLTIVPEIKAVAQNTLLTRRRCGRRLEHEIDGFADGPASIVRSVLRERMMDRGSYLDRDLRGRLSLLAVRA